MAKVQQTPEMTADILLFRQKLRVLREHYGLSRPKFSEELKIPQPSLKNYELGYRTPSLELLMLIQSSRFAPHVPWLLDRSAPADASQMGVPPER